MNDMTSAIVPKSDQQNADDYISGPRTIKITKVTIAPGEQPVSIFFEGDEGKPWKPCKSMSRVLVAAWGPDARAYAGRSATLYRDPTVKWGGLEVGGIRVSHLSDIDKPVTLALTATKGSRKPFTVKPLATAAPAPTLDLPAELAKMQAAAANGETALQTAWNAATKEARKALEPELTGLKLTAQAVDATPAEQQQQADDGGYDGV